MSKRQPQALIEAYQTFMAAAQPCLFPESEADYVAALEAVEYVLEISEDTLDDPMQPLIQLLSDGIGRYESQVPELVDFERQAKSAPLHAVVLVTLMDQYGLTDRDLPEVGNSVEVCQVLNGEKTLRRQSITALCGRFALKPALFEPRNDTELS